METPDPKLDPDHCESEQCSDIKCIQCYGHASEDIVRLMQWREGRMKDMEEEAKQGEEKIKELKEKAKVYDAEIKELKKKLEEWRVQYPTPAEAKVHWVGEEDDDIRVDHILLEGEEGAVSNRE